MKVKFKKLHPEAKTPVYAKPGDAGMDLTAVEMAIDLNYGYYEYNTGIAVAIPEGYVGLVYPRSSVSEYNLALANSVGVIDSGYRGPIKLRFIPDFSRSSVEYLPGDKVGQLIIIPYPKIELEEVTDLSSTERGHGGFGHTGV